MAIKEIKTTSNATRQMTVIDYKCDKNDIPKILKKGKKRISGRGSKGRISVRDRGRGAKRSYRLVDFSRLGQKGKKAKVEAINYDPNRSAFVALIKYEDGIISYIIAPNGLKTSDSIMCDDKTSVRVGNRMMLKNIPASTLVYNIELTPGAGGQMIRSAGSAATLLGFDQKHAQIKLNSGEVRRVPLESFASIGTVSNQDHSNVVIGKAGRKRRMGYRPHVRGKAKNPCDHPHGGGEGGSPIGMTYPKTPWGMPALGRKTRNKKKYSNKLIISK